MSMEPKTNTQINLETYQKVVEAELATLRRDNLNLKIVNCQLQEDLSALIEDFEAAQKQLEQMNNDKVQASVPLHVVKDTHINEHQ
jgi:hypothetical protein